MAATTTHKPLALDRNELALDRTLMAAGRTLMAWIRTGLSQISFGFGLYKFLHAVGNGTSAAARPIGLLLIGLGTLSLFAGGAEYVSTVRHLERQFGHSIQRVSPHLVLAIAIGVLGAALFVEILLRSDLI